MSADDNPSSLDRKRARRQPVDSIRSLLRSMPAVVWTTDRELVFRSSHGAGLAGLDQQPGDVEGTSLYEYFGTDDPDFLPILSHRQALQGHDAQFEFEWKARTFSVSVGPFRDPVGRIPGTIGVAVDITERKAREDALRQSHDELEDRVKERTAALSSAVARMEKELAERLQAEAALRDSQARFQAVIEDQSEFICRFLPDFTLTFVNQAYCRCFGRSESELLGRSFLPTIPADEREELKARIRSLNRGRRTMTTEHRVILPGGRIAWHQWSNRILFDDDGNLLEYQGVGRDVTDLRAARERAMQAGRLAAIGEVVTGLAHESRNALQRSQACLERLALRVHDRPEAAALIDGIQNAQNHLHHLYEAVRSYAAPIRLKLEPCDLGRVLREAWSHLGRLRVDRNVELIEEAADTDLHLVADELSLQQIVRNVLENALTAGDGPVRIRVCWSEDEWQGHAAVTCRITDNGPGIAADAKGRVFEPFFTTKTHGTGLGMAITRRIVEAHHGRIDVRNAENGGAEFRITLPRSRS